MDNNKNQRLVNYFSATLLILVIVIVSYTIYTQRTTLNNQPTVSTTQPLPDFGPGREYSLTEKQAVKLLVDFLSKLGFKNLDEINDLYSLLNLPGTKLYLISFFDPLMTKIIDQQEKTDLSPIREIAILLRTIPDDEDNIINIIFSDLSDFNKFQIGDLVILGIQIKDILNAQQISYAENDIFYLCWSINPRLESVGPESLYNPKDIFQFQNGIVVCNNGLKMDSQYRNWWWLGILNNDSYKVKIYLVDENTREKIQKSSSFSEAEEILNNYRLLYEKDITLPFE